MNLGKLEVVKQQMARVNINILGISELKWTGMGEFHSDDHYTYFFLFTFFCQAVNVEIYCFNLIKN